MSTTVAADPSGVRSTSSSSSGSESASRISESPKPVCTCTGRPRSTVVPSTVRNTRSRSALPRRRTGTSSRSDRSAAARSASGRTARPVR